MVGLAGRGSPTNPTAHDQMDAADNKAGARAEPPRDAVNLAARTGEPGRDAGPPIGVPQTHCPPRVLSQIEP